MGKGEREREREVRDMSRRVHERESHGKSDTVSSGGGG
jgi:hypothetical protein